MVILMEIMKPKILLLPFIAFCLSLISATCIPTAEVKPAEDTTTKTVSVKPSNKKMRFIQRLAFKMVMHKLKRHQYKADGISKADKLASASFGCGLASLVFMFLPFLTLLTLPLAVLAIIFGHKAKKSGTTKPSKARVGVALGIAAIILYTALIIFLLDYTGVFN
jgi:hypothetical protein